MPVNNILVGLGTLTLMDRSVTPNIPVPVAQLQDISLDLSYTTKELGSNMLYPVASARVSAAVSAKAKMAAIDGTTIGRILGASSATGSLRVFTETKVTGVTVTPTQANPVDMLVVLNKNGLRMVPVAVTPVADVSYTWNGTVLGFAAGQTGNITFTHTATVAGGNTAIINNVMIGATPTFESIFYHEFTDGQANLSYILFKFFAVTLPKFGLGFKPDDFAEGDLEMKMIARASDGKVGEIHTPN